MTSFLIGWNLPQLKVKSGLGQERRYAFNISYALFKRLYPHAIAVETKYVELCDSYGFPLFTKTPSYWCRVPIINLRRLSDGLRFILWIPIPAIRRLSYWIEAQVIHASPMRNNHIMGDISWMTMLDINISRHYKSSGCVNFKLVFGMNISRF